MKLLSRQIIGIDASRVSDPRDPDKIVRTGVEVYSFNLIKNLLPLLEKRGLEIRLYTPVLQKDLPERYQRIIPGKRFWTMCHLARELKRNPVDYFLTPGYKIPNHAPTKSFAYVHDVIFLSHPEKYSWLDRFSQKLALNNNLKRARKIFTVSEFSKREIARTTQYNVDKIVVAPIGIDPRVREESLVKENIILYVGRVEEKKSIGVLVKAFQKFRQDNSGWKLVLAGKPGFGYENILSLIKDLGLSDAVELKGYVSENKKKDLFLQASIFAHPNPDEGSSFPLLEAWDYGVPAIVPESQVFQELGNEAALFFKAGDSDDLADKIGYLVKNGDFAQALAAGGKEKVKNFSWQRTAEIVVKEILD